MSRDPYVHHRDDPTNIRRWLASKTGDGAGRLMQVPTPTPIIVHPEPPVPVAPPQRVLTAEEEWANMAPTHLWARPREPTLKPKAPEPVRRSHCIECGGPMPAIRRATKKYCSRHCKSVSDHRQERMVPYDPDTHRRRPVPR